MESKFDYIVESRTGGDYTEKPITNLEYKGPNQEDALEVAHNCLKATDTQVVIRIRKNK